MRHSVPVDRRQHEEAVLARGVGAQTNDRGGEDGVVVAGPGDDAGPHRLGIEIETVDRVGAGRRRVQERKVLVALGRRRERAVRSKGGDAVARDAVAGRGRFERGALVTFDPRNPGDVLDRRIVSHDSGCEGLEFLSTDRVIDGVEQGARRDHPVDVPVQTVVQKLAAVVGQRNEFRVGAATLLIGHDGRGGDGKDEPDRGRHHDVQGVALSQPPARAADETAQQRADRRLVEPPAAWSRRPNCSTHPRAPLAEKRSSARPVSVEILTFLPPSRREMPMPVRSARSGDR